MNGIYKAFGGKNNKWVKMGAGGTYLRSDHIFIQKGKNGWRVVVHGDWKSSHKTLKKAKDIGETWVSIQKINDKANVLGLIKQ